MRQKKPSKASDCLSDSDDIILFRNGTSVCPLFLGFDPSKTRSLFQSKQGAPFGFQVYISAHVHRHRFFQHVETHHLSFRSDVEIPAR